MDEATSKAAMEMEFRHRSRALEKENNNLKIQSELAEPVDEKEKCPDAKYRRNCYSFGSFAYSGCIFPQKIETLLSETGGKEPCDYHGRTWNWTI